MISISNMNFSYSNEEKLFENIELNLDTGGIYGLLGKNGAGKTTLLKILAGLIFPTQGSCTVMGHTPSKREPIFLEDIFYLPEDLYVPALSVQQYLQFYASFYPRFDYINFKNFQTEFAISNNKLLTEFSHGQKKKFLIAFGLATNCRVIILDEPTNGLDIPSKAQFRKLVVSATTDDKLFIISTHQVHDIENLIDNVIILDEGKIIFQQNIFEIANHLLFANQPTLPNPDSCLYYEKTIHGYNTITENTQDQDTQIDLEMLFNAVITNKKSIQTIFSQEK